MVFKDNDPGFGMKRTKLFIFLDCEDAHGRDGTRSPFFLQSTIFTKGDCFVSIEALNSPFLLYEACKPDFAVRV